MFVHSCWSSYGSKVLGQVLIVIFSFSKSLPVFWIQEEHSFLDLSSNLSHKP
ncbi:hypothetical protein LEP1GSC133_1557 [Leptospira borgpetersenii serovar Pomona str. 200901868]|uniref:Uncharacterized protein n=1 Tax=Leptospira borgpetersenii serovar Pomona str. 200901868 TaxID=1192866 RepID=M6W7U1_LEPBO|nr:hypothetical protein LEP1GSC133_1557 [Leptospira borgpetersenii serovar Pomona str. 200901868]